MTLAEHTPGPWSRNISPARKYCTVFAGMNQHICYLDAQNMSDPEAEANINLIVAAPDLLEAAITGEAIATAHFSTMKYDDPGKERYIQTVDKMRAAISKARGAA